MTGPDSRTLAERTEAAYDAGHRQLWTIGWPDAVVMLEAAGVPALLEQIAELDTNREPDREDAGTRSLSVSDLFPPEEHRYLSDDKIEELRQLGLPGGRVSLNGRTVIEIVCDLRNMEIARERDAQTITELRDRNEKLDDLLRRALDGSVDATLRTRP